MADGTASLSPFSSGWELPLDASIPPWGAARVVAGNPENSGPSRILSAGRSASQVVATLPSVPRGSQGIKPHLLYVAVQNPNMLHRSCSNHEKYRAHCTETCAVRTWAYKHPLHHKRVTEYGGRKRQSPFRLGAEAAKRKMLDPSKRPGSLARNRANLCGARSYFSPRIDRKRTTDSMPL